MESLESISAIVLSHGVKLAGEVVLNPSIQNGVILSVAIERSPSGRQLPTHKQLADIKSSLSNIDVYADFILIDSSLKMMEEGLRASLIASFPEIIRNSFLNIIEGIAHVWIDTKREIDANDHRRVNEHVAVYVDLFNVRGKQVHFLSSENIATNTEILSIIRRYSPVSCERLQEALISRGFAVPSLDWINRRFDALRKAGLLIRLPDRNYALTSEALHRLGTTKNRNSPDLGRLLALARGKR
ncbi:hypothetical protein GG804_25440 [Sphingomonas histidinilytica]|uniref:hypothetical protein n=1 Tax=Rhizorhabdus histidinilytica TaxID=439228 RepID=UPI001ADA1111|nr:hypothetical protein [Rhizorhabdus histidinilytica]MBO9380116.1 hypothetical protein [Rhizorhabdus histidinilytica]